MPFLTAASTCATLLTFTSEPMRVLFAAIVSSAILFVASSGPSGGKAPDSPGVATIFGFRNAAPETAAETQFLSVPDSKLAEEHLRILTKSPHMAGTIEDKATADYVAQKFREAGLDTEIVEYKVWINYPAEISVDMTGPAGVEMRSEERRVGKEGRSRWSREQ